MNNMNKSPEGQGPENPGRRGFLGKMFGVATVAAVAVGLGKAGDSKYLVAQEKNSTTESLKTPNEIFLYFKGHEGNPVKVKEAANMLKAIMVSQNISNVKTVGAGHENENITVLRDFLTSHVLYHTKATNEYKMEIVGTGAKPGTGAYTTTILDKIIEKNSK